MNIVIKAKEGIVNFDQSLGFLKVRKSSFCLCIDKSLGFFWLVESKFSTSKKSVNLTEVLLTTY